MSVGGALALGLYLYSAVVAVWFAYFVISDWGWMLTKWQLFWLALLVGALWPLTLLWLAVLWAKERRRGS